MEHLFLHAPRPSKKEESESEEEGSEEEEDTDEEMPEKKPKVRACLLQCVLCGNDVAHDGSAWGFQRKHTPHR